MKRNEGLSLMILLWLLVWLTGCGVNQESGDMKRINGHRNKERKETGRKILTEAIIFKTAAAIQNKYLDVYRDVFNNNQGRFYRFLSAGALSKKTFSRNKYEQPDDEIGQDGVHYMPYRERIAKSNGSYWDIQHIVKEAGIQDFIEKEGDVIVNPFLFLPASPILDPVSIKGDLPLLWDWFYAGILLEEDKLVHQVFPLLVEALKQKSSGDLATFEEMYRLYLAERNGERGNGDAPVVTSAPALAYYYLVTGNLDKEVGLSMQEERRLQEVVDYYNRNLLPQGYIVVNRFTLDNRVYMWLAARAQEQKGDMGRAYVYSKTTFGDDVLANIQQFNPNHQVYLYRTVRLGLVMNSPKIYRYIYGALDPLAKVLNNDNKDNQYLEFLKMQLLRLIK